MRDLAGIIAVCSGIWWSFHIIRDRCMEHSKELIAAIDEYTDLLADELTETVGIASVHGWKSSRYEKGEELRNRISELRGKEVKP